MQRVLHIVGKMDRAGAETMIMNLYRHIDRSKVQFDFITFTNEKGDYDDEIIELGGIVYPIISSNLIKRTLALKQFLIVHKEYKIVHAHTLFSNAFHMYAAKQAGVKNRLSHSHSTNNSSKNKLITYLYQEFSKIVIKEYSTNFIACGIEAAEFLFPSQSDVLILPNSINIDQYASIGSYSKNYLEEEFSIPQGILKIIQVGRLQSVKNHSFSIKIAKLLKEKEYEFKMFFVGQGCLENQLKKEVTLLGLDEYFIFTGVRTDVPNLMAGADVMLMPSFYEGFPVVLVESQAVGLRSVISDTISSEVNLNVGLVDFVSLDAPIHHWIDVLTNSNNMIENRVDTLKRKGFDITSNAISLQKLYQNLN